MSILAVASFNVVFRLAATEKKKFLRHHVKLHIYTECACSGGHYTVEDLHLFLPFTNPSLPLTQYTRIYLSESLQLIDPSHLLTGGYAATVTTLQTVLQQKSQQVYFITKLQSNSSAFFLFFLL